MSNTNTADTNALVLELENFFLPLAWTLRSRAGEILGSTRDVRDLRKIYLEPLTLPSGYAGHNESSVTLVVLNALVRELQNPRRRGESRHLFLKTLTPALSEVLLESGFDESPVLRRFLEKIPKYFDLKNHSRTSRPYWSLKDMWCTRATKVIETRKRWIFNVATRLYEEHTILQNKDVRQGLGLIVH